MYAVGTIGLSLVWGALRMLNMAHGVLLTIGGYICYAVITHLGVPIALGLPAAMAVGALVGLALYYCAVRFMYRHPNFENNVFIATFGIALALENFVLVAFGAYPFPQPFAVPDGFRIGEVFVRYQNVLIFVVSITVMVAVAWALKTTRIGRAIRATAQNRDAAQLMGVPVGRVFAQVLAIAGMLAAVSGVMLSSIASLSPSMGYDPMLKAFIICVIAGLGNVIGTLYAALALGLFEAAVQFIVGVRFGFASMLLLVILVLIYRPYGLFGRREVTKL